ncbi:MAG: DUF1761 domain-containing protein [Alphaproteobacteria bacterium]
MPRSISQTGKHAMVNYLAVLLAAVAGFAFGSVWYMALAKPWMAAVGMSEPPKPRPLPFIVAFLAQLLMAYMLAGALGHLGDVSVQAGAIAAALFWLGFVATTMSVNHRFAGAPWSLTAIDAGHWLGVLVVMGVVLGLFGVDG